MPEPQFVAQLVVNGLMASLTYILIALGLTLIFSIMDIVNFAHGELYMLGSFGAFYIYDQLKLNFFLTLIISMLLVGTLSVVMEKTLFYRLRREVLLSFIIALGLVMILQSIMQIAAGVEDKPITAPYTQVWRIFGASIGMRALLPAVVGAVLAAALVLFLRYMKQGKMLRAVAQDMDAAALQGISISNSRMLAWFIGGALAAAAGVMMAPLMYINAYVGQLAIMKAFIICVIGGLGSIPGAILAGLVLGVVDGIGASFITSQGAALLGFALAMLIIFIKPTGLLGHA